MPLTPDQTRAVRIFFPFAHARQEEVRSEGTRFVHYTNADAAMNILRTKEVWMRESSCMNDFTEVQHGLNCVLAAYHAGDRAFKRTLDSVFPGISDEIEKLFDGWTPHLRNETYMACFSKHLPEEDTFGRLSMWRAYSEVTGVAFVMNNAPFLAESGMKVYASPVAYLNDKGFAAEFENVRSAIEAEGDFLKALGRPAVINCVFRMLMFASLCTKHPGFGEEREWRVIYCPPLERSEYVIRDIQSIGGAPQPIYKIPLKDIPEAGFAGAAIPALIERIIIGPTQYPLAMWKAFTSLLADAGMENAAAKVFVSDIPLRR